jgi:hypothetical protein
METVYVLQDDDSILGVFSSPDISDETLESYFGEFEVVENRDVRDSGIEWVKVIRARRWDNVIITLHSFCMNEII